MIMCFYLYITTSHLCFFKIMITSEPNDASASHKPANNAAATQNNDIFAFTLTLLAAGFPSCDPSLTSRHLGFLIDLILGHKGKSTICLLRHIIAISIIALMSFQIKIIFKITHLHQKLNNFLVKMSNFEYNFSW